MPLGEAVEVAHRDADVEVVGAQGGVGNSLGERDRARDDDGRIVRLPTLSAGLERLERSDAKADEVRWRREMRLVSRASRGVVADAPRRQVGAERAREVAGGDVVGRDDSTGRSPSACSESIAAASRNGRIEAEAGTSTASSAPIEAARRMNRSSSSATWSRCLEQSPRWYSTAPIR